MPEFIEINLRSIGVRFRPRSAVLQEELDMLLPLIKYYIEYEKAFKEGKV